MNKENLTLKNLKECYQKDLINHKDFYNDETFNCLEVNVDKIDDYESFETQLIKSIKENKQSQEIQKMEALAKKTELENRPFEEGMALLVALISVAVSAFACFLSIRDELVICQIIFFISLLIGLAVMCVQVAIKYGTKKYKGIAYYTIKLDYLKK